MMLTTQIQSEDIEKYASPDLLPVLRKLPENQLKHIFKIYDSDKVVALGGVVKIREGLGEAWITITDLPTAQQKALSLVRACMRHLDEVALAEGFWRIQATARQGDIRSCEFLKVLRFNEEGILYWYGPDRADHLMFSALYA